MHECMNEETTSNMIALGELMIDPLSIINNGFDIQKDFNIFAQMAEIMENLSKCHFEESAFDIMTMCTKDPKSCEIAKLIENLTKNMFVLIGKMSAMAEILQGFPATSNGEFKE